MNNLNIKNINSVVAWTLGIYRFARKFRGVRPIIRKLKIRLNYSIVGRLNQEFTPKLHDLADHIKKFEDVDRFIANSDTRSKTSEVCTAYRDLVADLLLQNNHDIYVCFKVVKRDIDDSNQAVNKIIGIGQSKPNNLHPEPNNFKGQLQLIEENSVYAALFGINDSKSEWSHPHSLFCCNDLENFSFQYACDRKNHLKHYNSVFALPLRYPHVVGGRLLSNKILGCIVFYSPHKNIFVGLPNIFKAKSHSAYILEAKSPLYHLGKFLADNLTYQIKPTFEALANDKLRHDTEITGEDIPERDYEPPKTH